MSATVPFDTKHTVRRYKRHKSIQASWIRSNDFSTSRKMETNKILESNRQWFCLNGDDDAGGRMHVSSSNNKTHWAKYGERETEKGEK